MDRSAVSATGVSSVAVLFVGSGSGVEEVAAAVFVRVPDAVLLSVPRMRTTILLPAARSAVW